MILLILSLNNRSILFEVKGCTNKTIVQCVLSHPITNFNQQTKSSFVNKFYRKSMIINDVAC